MILPIVNNLSVLDLYLRRMYMKIWQLIWCMHVYAVNHTVPTATGFCQTFRTRQQQRRWPPRTLFRAVLGTAAWKTNLGPQDLPPRKFNIDTTNGHVQKEPPFPNHHFGYPYSIGFPGCTWMNFISTLGVYPPKHSSTEFSKGIYRNWAWFRLTKNSNSPDIYSIRWNIPSNINPRY